jgi:hypothetical protein
MAIKPEIARSFPERAGGGITGPRGVWDIERDWMDKEVLETHIDFRKPSAPWDVSDPYEWRIFLIQFQLPRINATSAKLRITPIQDHVYGRFYLVDCSLRAYPVISADTFQFVWDRRVHLADVKLSGLEKGQAVEIDLGQRAVEYINKQMLIDHPWIVIAYAPIHLYSTSQGSVWGHTPIYGPASGRGPVLLLTGDPIQARSQTQTGWTQTIYTTQTIYGRLVEPTHSPSDEWRQSLLLFIALASGLGAYLLKPK